MWRWLLVTLLVGWLGLDALPTTPVGASAQPASPRLSGVDFLTGYHVIAPWAFDFPRIKADGANTVSFDVWWRVPDFGSNSVAPDYTKIANLTPTDTDADLLTATRAARRAGLNVTLTPKVVIGSNVNNSGWRGLYNPPNPAKFFTNYTAMIEHYASLAQQAGMSDLLVGSEMIASDRYASYWRQVIGSARRYFTGRIGYEVDWREMQQFSWGDAVDDLLLSAYFPTSNEEHPTPAQLEAGWHSYRAPGQASTQDAFTEVSNFARRWHKPIIFGEAGYTATTYPADQPWWNKPNPTVDSQSQYVAYQALLDTFVGQPWWGGVLWWAWNDSVSRSPEHKPAEALLSARCVSPTLLMNQPGAVGGPCATRLASYGSSSSDRGRVASGIALGALVLAVTALVALGWLSRSPRVRES
jgi:hypothetical protein